MNISAKMSKIAVLIVAGAEDPETNVSGLASAK